MTWQQNKQLTVSDFNTTFFLSSHINSKITFIRVRFNKSGKSIRLGLLHFPYCLLVNNLSRRSNEIQLVNV